MLEIIKSNKKIIIIALLILLLPVIMPIIEILFNIVLTLGRYIGTNIRMIEMGVCNK